MNRSHHRGGRPLARTEALPLIPRWTRTLLWWGIIFALALFVSIASLRMASAHVKDTRIDLADQNALLASDKADDDSDGSPTKFA